MADPITLVVESTITAGKYDDLVALISEVSSHCAATEPGLQRYDWFVNDDRTEVRVVEQYADSDALRFHLRNYASYLPAMAECRTPVRFTLLGEPDEALAAAMAERGALVFTSLASLPD